MSQSLYQTEELSDEDIKLKDELEMLVERLQVRIAFFRAYADRH